MVRRGGPFRGIGSKNTRITRASEGVKIDKGKLSKSIRTKKGVVLRSKQNRMTGEPVQITASLSMDGKTETITTKSNGSTRTSISRRGGGSVTFKGKLSESQQRKIAKGLADQEKMKQQGKTLAQQKAALEKLKQDRQLKARIVETRTRRVVQAGRFDISRRDATAIAEKTKTIKNAEQRRSKELELQRTLINIDNDTKLNQFQKEIAKRNVLGITISSITQKAFTNKQIESKARKITGIIGPNTNSYITQVTDLLSARLRRIRNLPPEKRTLTNNIDAVFSGIGSTAILTVAKIPKKTLDFMIAILRPDQMAIGLFKLATDPAVQSAVNSKIAQFSKELQRGDPAAISELTSEMIGFKAGNKILTETGKVASVSKGVRILQEIRFVRSQPAELRPFVKQILKASRVQEKLTPNNLKGIKKLNFNEVTELTKVEAAALKATLKETESFVFGSLGPRAISKGKTKIPKDVDIATKNQKLFSETFIEKLPKAQQKNYLIKGEKVVTKTGRALFDIKAYSRLRPDQTIFGTGRLPINTIIYRTNKPVLKQAGLIQPTQKLVQIEGIKLIGFGEQTTRKGLGTLQVLLEKTGRRAKDPAAFIESLEIQLAALEGKIPKTNIVNKFLLKVKAKDLRNALKILKSKEFQNILNKKVPGLLKEYPILTKLKNTKFGEVTKRVNEKINNIKTKLKEKVTSKKKPSTKKKSSTKKKTSTTKKKTSSIPKSKIPSKIPKSRIPKSKIPSKIPKSRIPKSRVPSRLKPSRTPISRVPPSKIPTTRIPTSKVPSSKVPTSKTPTSKTPTSKTPSSRVPSSKIPPIKSIAKTPPRKTVRIPSKNFDSTAYKDRIVKYEGVFRERKFRSSKASKSNPVIIKILKINDTRNRALKKVADLADRRTVRSISIRVVGVTNKKKTDINSPQVLRKFKVKKSKNTPVLGLVEEPKYFRDRPGESRELRARRKPRKPIGKKSKPKKTVTKKKKKTNKKKKK